jgi:4-amino-4-deoxy-L-arabinose transferase-like glycosyltransferase
MQQIANKPVFSKLYLADMNTSVSDGKLAIWLSHHWIAASLIIFVCSSVLRVFLAWQTDLSGPIFQADGASYIAPAQSLIRHQGFLDWQGKPEVTRTPGYPSFLAVLMLLVGQDLRKVLIAQAVVLSFQVVVLYWLAKRIVPAATAFIAGLLAAFSPWGAVHAGLPMTEGLFLLLLALIFFAMKLTTETHNKTALVIGGISIGLFTAAAVLVRPVWPLILLSGGTLFLLYGPTRKGVWVLLFTTLVFAATPVLFWKARNQVRGFDGLSDIAGKCALLYLASRVNAQTTQQDRWALKRRVGLETNNWKLPIQQADNERWRRAEAVFREHPVLTGYYFLLSSAEHAIHPSPDVLSPAKLNFRGDYWVLALLWGGLLSLAFLGWQGNSDPGFESGTTQREWLLGLLVVCLLLTLSSGLCFGAGSRYRVSLELIVPLLAAAGLLRMFRLIGRSI